jgi:hypothetical protein
VWAFEEDTTLARLAIEHGFHHWRCMENRMLGRSHDDELAHLVVRHADRCKAISHMVYHRTSRIMWHRWKEIHNIEVF